MRALVKAHAKRGLWMMDQPVPEIGPNDLLVRIGTTAICGTDLHIYDWDAWSSETIEVPLIIGHEFMGIVERIGSQVSGFEIGDRVSGEGHVTCGHCRNCRAGRRHLCRNTRAIGVTRPGAFAEYLSIPAVNAFRLPEAIPDQVGAILDPLGNAVHTALSFDLVGEDVLITGAGPIGVMAAAVALHVGARHVIITDLNEYRLELARQRGVTRAIHVEHTSIEEAQRELGMLEGFDVGMEMSGSTAAIHDLLANMNHGGRVAVLGIPSAETTIDWSQVIFKGLVLKGIYGREMFETWYKMASLLQSGLDVSPLITHSLQAEEYLEAFELMGSGQTGKVLLDWSR
jgi:threonine 3-dehydrogenase